MIRYSVGQRSSLLFTCWGKGALVFYKHHISLPHLVQWITRECFTSEDSPWWVDGLYMLFRSVGQRSSPLFTCWGKGALVFNTHLFFCFIVAFRNSRGYFSHIEVGGWRFDLLTGTLALDRLGLKKDTGQFEHIMQHWRCSWSSSNYFTPFIILY